jgi:hypothetical protein
LYLAHITNLQTKLRIEQTEQGRIALVGCETDKPSSSGTAAAITSLAQNPTLIPLVQNNRSPIHFLVLHEKHGESQIKVHNAYFAF